MKNNQNKFDTLMAFTELSINFRIEVENIYGVTIYFDPLNFKYSYTQSDTILLLCEAFCISMNMLINPYRWKYNEETVREAIFASLLFAGSLHLHKCYALFASGLVS